ncbi:pseudouridine synthase [Kallipyga gabonensis]|uniref:pseudouridine synthase n=1 Tax=Kallipyga gabonensis TaxID=1686287 RepID=UPI0006B4D956|nr:pseudouridine synthase [Kallipyga gabonensis]
MTIRLDKLLANASVGSRKEVGLLIREGRVEVDGVVVEKPGKRVEEGARLLVDGKALEAKKYVYYLLHKPEGVISATRDQNKTVLDVIRPEDFRKGLFPVGRLDKDTTGLLLLTNNGDLAHRLLSPKRGIEKTYLARVDKELREEDVQAFKKGFLLLPENIITRPAKLIILGDTLGQVTITEGKYHQVKRMFAKVGKEVLQLKRIAMGPLQLGNLEKGSYRPLSEEEVAKLQQL